MMKRAVILSLLLFSVSVLGEQCEVDSAKTVGLETISGYVGGTVIGIAGHFIAPKRDDNSWMSPGFAYLFPLGATAGVVAVGEMSGTPIKNSYTSIGITLALAYLPLLLGEIINVSGSRELNVLFSPLVAIVTYNYIKSYDARNSKDSPDVLIFSFSTSF